MNKIKYYTTMPIEEVIRYASQNALEGSQAEIVERVVGYYQYGNDEALAQSERDADRAFDNGREDGYEDGLKDGREAGYKDGYRDGYDRAIELLTTLKPGKE